MNGNIKNDTRQTRRITLTVTTELYNLLNEISALNGKSMSYFPSYVLEESIPTFKALIKAYETAKTNKEKAVQDIVQVAEEKMADTAMLITRD